MNYPYLKPIYLFCICLFLTSCKTNVLVLEDVMPTARFQNLEIEFEQMNFQDFNLHLGLIFEVRNPYDKVLPIPEHEMALTINDDNRPVKLKKTARNLAANSSDTIRYQFVLDPAFLTRIWGKINKLSFSSDIKINLDEFVHFLPDFELGVTENFELESDKLKPIAKKLLQKKVGTQNIHLNHNTFVKVPTPPGISPANEPIRLNWIGEMDNLVAINTIKDGLTPFGDLLINGSLNNLKNPFIDAMVNSTVTIPTPVWNCWDCTTEIAMEDQVIDLLSPLDSDIEDKWSSIKSILYKEQSIPLADYLVDNFISTYADVNASSKWQEFKAQWEVFKNADLPAAIPGPDTKGFEIVIPVLFTNNNEFPIDLPLFRSSVFAFNSEPFRMQIKPKGMSEVSLSNITHIEIGAKQSKTLYTVFTFNMHGFENGIFSLFNGAPMNPNIEGVMSYDIGYGPIYWNYDLNNLLFQYDD
ncbi:MAG: hypothetical protein DWQ02_16465 [Bacteroidetes bacterium]|nr:MAG: hypothetical protein DWQ02_16465 [Bacteroidota bacterium]